VLLLLQFCSCSSIVVVVVAVVKSIQNYQIANNN